VERGEGKGGRGGVVKRNGKGEGKRREREGEGTEMEGPPNILA